MEVLHVHISADSVDLGIKRRTSKFHRVQHEDKASDFAVGILDTKLIIVTVFFKPGQWLVWIRDFDCLQQLIEGVFARFEGTELLVGVQSLHV